MKRLDNKGFNLIDVLIAVAILSLLITPILAQVNKTNDVNRDSKERQYAIENANFVLEYFQAVPADSLNALGLTAVATTGDATVDKKISFVKKESIGHGSIMSIQTGVTYSSMTNYTTVKETDAYKDLGPDKYSDDTDTVHYNTQKYYLEDVTLGHEKHDYSRVVYVDNLYAQLAANNLVVRTSFSDTAKEAFEADGWSFTTEGACVKYWPDGTIQKVVCEKFTAGAMNNPNGNGLGYMQDLDSDKVAIIDGRSMTYDTQAAKDLMTLKLDRLRRSNYPSWVQYVKSQTGTSIFDTALYTDNVNKMTKVSITSGYDVVHSKKYYDVVCTVYYEDFMTRQLHTVSDASDVDDSVPEYLGYNAYSKRFYTNQAPDIYMMYEPYVYGSVYANSDFITLYDGVAYKSGDKHSKFYLIKPDQTKLSVSGPLTNVYYKNATTPVKVYLNYLYGTAYNQPMDIYTNMDLTSQFKYNLSLNNTTGNTGTQYPGVQYGPNNVLYHQVIKTEEATDCSDKLTLNVGNIKRDNYDSNKVHKISDDVIKENRLFTITVELQHDNTKIRLTGAKGAE